MQGSCDRFYDDNLNVNSTILSVKVISGEFELFDQTNHRLGSELKNTKFLKVKTI